MLFFESLYAWTVNVSPKCYRYWIFTVEFGITATFLHNSLAFTAVMNTQTLVLCFYLGTDTNCTETQK